MPKPENFDDLCDKGSFGEILRYSEIWVIGLNKGPNPKVSIEVESWGTLETGVVGKVYSAFLHKKWEFAGYTRGLGDYWRNL